MYWLCKTRGLFLLLHKLTRMTLSYHRFDISLHPCHTFKRGRCMTYICFHDGWLYTDSPFSLRCIFTLSIHSLFGLPRLFPRTSIPSSSLLHHSPLFLSHAHTISTSFRKLSSWKYRRPQVDLAFLCFQLLAPLQRLRVIVCGFTRRGKADLCVSASSRTMLAFGNNVSCSSSACSTLLRFVVGNVEVNTLAS